MSADISQTLLPMHVIKHRIGAIFPDVIVLNNEFRVVAMSQNILDGIGYGREELLNRSVRCLSRNTDLEQQLKEKLRQGYFVDEHFEIHGKSDKAIHYTISGFYLGIISDTNGLIVLRLRNQDEINLQHDKAEAKTAEIDRFVYVSAHALRGPLATMKGLINVARTYSTTDELTFLTNQLEQYAEKLDDKLHKLIYFAESDKGHEAPSKTISLGHLLHEIEATIINSHIDHQVNFSCMASDKSMAFENGEVLLSLFRNLIRFFCHQQKEYKNELKLDVHSNPDMTEIVLQAKGFLPNDLLKAKLSAVGFSYSEILNYPELINYYAVKKIVFKLRADIQFVLSEGNDVTVLINIPGDVQLSK
jgi:light-regulated signal transduction histidine kinase (bacteriophytochrome)